jgi:predicted aspartyl protease
MAVLNGQLQVQAQQPDGTRIALPPNVAMQQFGPRLQVMVGFSTLLSTTLSEQGMTIPAPVAGWAMIDTGASSTCIDAITAQQLGLPAIDVVQMGSASHDATEQNVYPAMLEVVGATIRFEVPRAIGAALANQGLIALIGRDLLQICTLHYNGPTGQFTLAL